MTNIKIADYLRDNGDVMLDDFTRAMEDGLSEAIEAGTEAPEVEFPNGSIYPIPAVYYVANMMLKEGFK